MKVAVRVLNSAVAVTDAEIMRRVEACPDHQSSCRISKHKLAMRLTEDKMVVIRLPHLEKIAKNPTTNSATVTQSAAW